MKQQASFVGWDFANTWTICEGLGYPRLQWEAVDCGRAHDNDYLPAWSRAARTSMVLAVAP